MNREPRRLSFIFLLLLITVFVHGQTITTDKVDYMPGDKMIVSGKGWLANETVNLVLTEQELLDPSWTDVTKTVVCDASGNFSIGLYDLVQANLGAFFHITATGQVSNHVSTITCNDAGGDYGIDFSAYIPQSYDSYNISNVPTAPEGRGVSPLGPTRHNNTKESLMPQYLALGQIVAYEFIVRVDAGGACTNDKIRIGGEFMTVTTNGGLFGFEDASINLFAAFVDTDPDDIDYIDNGTQATVSSFGEAMDGTAVSAWVELEGMDPGDVILVELWVVLQDEIAESVGGNVKTRLANAAAIGTCEPGKINTGNQEVPLLQVGDFFTTDVDISVIKTDDHDPVNPGDEITYTMVVHNEGPSVANGVILTDLMDPNTTYVPDSWDASSSIPANDVMWQSISVSGQTITTTTDNIYLKIGETVTITYKVKVNLDAPATATGGAGSPTSCVAGADLCNFVSVSTISDDTNPANDQYYQPTGVNGLNIVLVPSPITCWNYDGYTSDGAIDLTITGGPMVSSYSWTGPLGFLGSTNQDLTGLNIPGEYTVTITFSNGLVITRSATVTAPLYQCTVEAGDYVSICFGESVTLTALASGGIEPYTYEWFDDVGLSHFIGSGASIIVAPEATTSYYVKATDANGCYGIDEVTVTVNPRPVLTVQDLTECSTDEGGNTATFNFLANVSAVGGNLAFTSSINGSLLLDEMNAYVGTNGEIITVSSTSPPPGLCQTIKSFTITVHPSPILQAATATFCDDNQSNTILADYNAAIGTVDGQSV
ncbi:protein containing conserved repeat domain, partial [Bacteroidales bacterium 6E]